MTSLRGPGERNFNAVSNKQTRAPIQSVPVSFGLLACSRLRDSGEKSFSKKKCEKLAGAGESFSPPPPPFPRRVRLIFALLVLYVRNILSESLAQAMVYGIRH